ncbi:DNA topoisomerase III [Entomortierella parvispora]|uniref:DNA topoisomerase n=1 Tax=Entomortierella parvispora TaxID=205924 RepID=A0A9P3H7C2_9FUNG|nr:DNA topoisomerase III [Entomortierella parvispora]
MRILCVAEKPSMSKALAQILSSGERMDVGRGSKFIYNYSFPYKIDNRNMVEVTMTAVVGHLQSLDFHSQYRSWLTVAPVELFEAGIQKHISKDLEDVARNLQENARRADQVMIWTDCDREGENIGAEVAAVCQRANARITVIRARFSSVTPAEVHRAMRNPVQLDQHQADAVDARTELDLRIGASFTRFQTLSFQNLVFDHGPGKKSLISFGPCQFPTLGFVVDQYRKVERFTPEKFWKLELKHRKDGEEACFNWERGQIFDQLMCFIIYESCLDISPPKVTITEVKSKSTSKWKPLPLTTVELQKSGSKYLAISSDEIMKAAESLYTQGWISYPRTETDQFDHNYDLLTLVQKQTESPNWGTFAQRLVEGGYRIPRRGKNNDQAHPPIHPVMHTQNLPEREKKVYEFIVRRFLACCSEDAKGDQTNIVATLHTETFRATGLIIKERNYLDVYPYDKWTGTTIPDFIQGEQFTPSSFKMVEGSTTSPSLLTESQLIALMDERGIGTDATISDHIKTITDREYVKRSKQGKEFVFSPSTLGIALVEGYDGMQLPKNLSKPLLRSQLERNLKLICTGERRKEDVIAEALAEYKAIFEDVNRMKGVLKQSIERNVDPPPRGGQNDIGGGGGGGGGGGEGGGGRPRGGGGGNGTRQIPPPANPYRPQQTNQSQSNAEHQPAMHGRSTVRNGNKRNLNARDSTLPTDVGLGSLPNVGVVICNCEGSLPAVERKVIKEGENQGRLFFICSKPREEQCGFFCFSDELNNRPEAPRRFTNDRLNPQRSDDPGRALLSSNVFRDSLNAGSNLDGKPRCSCGLIAIESTSAKNNGRVYWKCSKVKTCQFFKWDDELEQSARSTTTWSASGASRSGNGSGSSSAAGDRSCYKCHQVGHFANACPNGASEGSSSFQPNNGSSTRGKGRGKKVTTSGSNIKAARVSKKSRPQ